MMACKCGQHGYIDRIVEITTLLYNADGTKAGGRELENAKGGRIAFCAGCGRRINRLLKPRPAR